MPNKHQWDKLFLTP